jgi:hypothetical protein
MSLLPLIGTVWVGPFGRVMEVMLQRERDEAAGPPLVFWIVYLAVLAFMIYCYWRVFEKAGEPGWAAIIPIYNTFVWLKIAGKPWWWLLLMFVPLLNIVIYVIAAIDFGRAFGKSTAFSIVLLVLLPFIGYPMLAFSDDRYQGQGTPAMAV